MTGKSLSARKGAYSSAGYRRARLHVLAENPLCTHCGKQPSTEADHVPPLSLHDHVPGTDCCVLVASCSVCARKQGGMLGGHVVRTKSVEVIEPEPVPVEVFKACPWLKDLLKYPGIQWPRLMTAPHPDAVGSYGVALEQFSASFHGQPLRWWQRLAARRLLEHDKDGHLVWPLSILTVARQVGKSYLLGDIQAWRLHSGDLFGGPQTVVATGKDVSVCLEVMRPYLIKALGDKRRYHCRQVNGQHEIRRKSDNSRLMVRAKHSVYGLSASLATVDEAWAVLASILDDALEPTTVASADSQIMLVSTAHRKATALMIGRRASALANLRTGDGPLILEWSAPPTCALDDRAAWRMASPVWDAKREKLIAKRLEGALAGESDDVDEPDPLASFTSQWLNRWPSKRLANVKGEALVEMDVWEALRGETHDNPEKVWIGVEDHSGFGAAIAMVCIQPDGRLGLDGWLTNTWGDAITDLRRLIATHEIVKLQAGASLLPRLAPGMRATPVTSAVTRSTLPAMRSLISAGAIVHDSEDLDEQIESVRVVEAIGGLGLVAGIRSDLLRAASWALAAASRPAKSLSIH